MFLALSYEYESLGIVYSFFVFQEGQESVAEATSSVLRKMYEGQQDLMVGHQTLKDAHNDIHKYVADNLKELTREKALIATGNKELAELNDQIRTKMGKFT